MRPDKETITFHVDTGTCPEVLETELVRGGCTLAEAREAIDALVTDGTLTRGHSHPKDSSLWIVVTAWSPNMAATIRSNGA